MKTFIHERARQTLAHMIPALRDQRMRAILKHWRAICNKRGLTRAQKDEIFENILIHQYGLHATARRDYQKIVKIGIKTKR